MAYSTLLEEYLAKKRKYDAQIDREWAAFAGASWDGMSESQRSLACDIAERQGCIQKRMYDSYNRERGVTSG